MAIPEVLSQKPVEREGFRDVGERTWSQPPSAIGFEAEDVMPGQTTITESQIPHESQSLRKVTTHLFQKGLTYHVWVLHGKPYFNPT